AARDQRVRRNVVAGDEIDLAAEERGLCERRAVAELEGDFHPKFLPDAGALDHLPDREMRVRAKERPQLERRIILFGWHKSPILVLRSAATAAVFGLKIRPRDIFCPRSGVLRQSHHLWKCRRASNPKARLPSYS